MEVTSCHDVRMSLEDLDHAKDKIAVFNSLEMTSVGHNAVLITDSLEVGSQKPEPEELTVIQTEPTDTVYIVLIYL